MISTCDVCQRERDVRVGALPFAPMSVAFCAECLREGAYPLWTLHAAIDMAGGVEHLADWMTQLRSFTDGHYIDWDVVVRDYVPMPLEQPS